MTPRWANACSTGTERVANSRPDDILAEAVSVGRLPSAVGACFTGDRVLWKGAAGTDARVGGHAADTLMQYRIGSITKMMTAVGVMQLRDGGHAALGDPVARFVADAPFGDCTLRVLMSHSAGLPAEPEGFWWERNPGVGCEELWRRNARRRAVFARGERYHYSNLSFAILGAVIEEISGLDWMAYLDAEVLGPLDMRDTTYLPGPRAAEGTSRTPAGRLVREPAEDTRAMAPAGQLWSTISDLAVWGAFLVGRRPDVLAPGTLVEMQTVQSGDPSTQHESAYGLGHRLTWSPSGTLVGHSGSMPGFLADLQVNPRTGVGAVMLTNATTMATRHNTARELVSWASDQVADSGDQADVPWGTEPLVERARPTMTGGERRDINELLGRWYWGNAPYDLTSTETGFALTTTDRTWHFVDDEVDTYLGVSGYPAGETLRVIRDADRVVRSLEVTTFVLSRINSPD
jgi:CubicO group peptidase (beta-lactamase class C family)